MFLLVSLVHGCPAKLKCEAWITQHVTRCTSSGEETLSSSMATEPGTQLPQLWCQTEISKGHSVSKGMWPDQHHKDLVFYIPQDPLRKERLLVAFLPQQVIPILQLLPKMSFSHSLGLLGLMERVEGAFWEWQVPNKHGSVPTGFVALLPWSLHPAVATSSTIQSTCSHNALPPMHALHTGRSWCIFYVCVVEAIN